MSELPTFGTGPEPEPSAPPSGAGPENPASERRATRKRLVAYVVVAAVVLLALVALGFYTWRAVSVRSLEGRLASERAESTSAQRQALSAQARDLLRLTARPLAWSVRAELLRGNTGQVDDYFRELVHEPGVVALMLVDKDGKVVLATNRKLETQPAASFVSAALLSASEVATEEKGSSLRLAVPVMGFDRRLGTLVIDYDLQAR